MAQPHEEPTPARIRRNLDSDYWLYRIRYVNGCEFTLPRRDSADHAPAVVNRRREREFRSWLRGVEGTFVSVADHSEITDHRGCPLLGVVLQHDPAELSALVYRDVYVIQGPNGSIEPIGTAPREKP